MTRCDHCPAGPTCRSPAMGTRSARNQRLCDLADPSHPDHDPDILPILRGDPHPDYARRGVSPPRSSGLSAPLDPWAYVTAEDLTRDARSLVGHLPPDVDLVCAIPRSGLLPGSLLAYHLHVPLVTVSRQRGIVEPGHGVRLEGRAPAPPRRVLLVDDTVASGREMAACTPIVRAAYPGAEVTRAVVYAHPQAAGSVDLFARLYPGSHYLDWNWPNAGHGELCAFDFDGILCEDCPPADDDDGPRYLNFLGSTRPLYLPRRAAVPLIVTARREEYRAETLGWLTRHGLRCDRLVMRDWAVDPAGDWNGQVAAWKADHFGRSGCDLMAESDPAQARIINEITGKPVICPAAARVFPPAPGGLARDAGRPSPVEALDLTRRMRACPERTPCSTCAMGKATCGLGKGRGGVVFPDDCRRCLQESPAPAEDTGGRLPAAPAA